jgi:small conductance mechanosensitive channel
MQRLSGPRGATQARQRAAAAPRVRAARARSGAGRPRAARPQAGRRGGARVGAYRGTAQRQLSRFRQGTILAVAITAWLLLLLGAPDVAGEQADPLAPGGTAAAASSPAAAGSSGAGTAASGAGPLALQQPQAPAPAGQAPQPPPPEAEPQATAAEGAVELERSVGEAASTVRDLAVGFMALLPKLLVAFGLLAIAALISAIVRPLLRRALGTWPRADAMAALSGILIWLVAISAALSVIVGDPRTLLGSVGLIGLALSWALQQPIESFTAWLLNSFRGYYRIGDRIGVGDVFGDVYRIDFLTTTVWEAGGPEKPVQGAQPTGALVTFPNAEVLRANVVNYTRDFPYVWDEIDIPVTNESDLRYAGEVLLGVARQVVGPQMAEPIQRYLGMLQRASLDFEIADEPQVFFSQTDSWTNATIRYLVDARRRRITASELLVAVSDELAKPEHAPRLTAAYPTAKLKLVDTDGAHAD